MIAYEPLVGDNQYHCDACQRRVDALLNVSYRKLPEVLILCLFRFEYDFKSGTRIKNTRDFKFPMALDMFPFTEESLARRPLPKTVEEALTMGSKEFGRLELPLLVDDDSNTKTESTEKLFEGRFDPESPHLYDLTNVVIHVGGDAGFGHYHAYIR
jgi:ubiquitin C-terminal hydrolase